MFTIASIRSGSVRSAYRFDPTKPTSSAPNTTTRTTSIEGILAARDRPGDRDADGSAGTVGECAVGDVVGVEMGSQEYLRVGLGAERRRDGPAGRLADLGVDGDRQPLAVVSARQAGTDLLRDPDRGDLADRPLYGADAAGRREVPGDVISKNERGRTRLDCPVVLLAAVDEPIVVVENVARDHDDAVFEGGVLEIRRQTRRITEDDLAERITFGSVTDLVRVAEEHEITCKAAFLGFWYLALGMTERYRRDRVLASAVAAIVGRPDDPGD